LGGGCFSRLFSPSKGSDPRLDPAGPRGENIMSYFPRWPSPVLRQLSQKMIHGNGAVIFDSQSFFDFLHLSAAPVPVVFPHAAYKLQLDLGDVTAMVNQSVMGRESVREVIGSDYARKSVLPFLSGGVQHTNRKYMYKKSNLDKGHFYRYPPFAPTMRWRAKPMWCV